MFKLGLEKAEEPEIKLPTSAGSWKNHSFDYMDLCWQSNVSGFNTLSRLVIAFLPRSKCLLTSWLQSPSAVILEPKKITADGALVLLQVAIQWPLALITQEQLEVWSPGCIHLPGAQACPPSQLSRPPYVAGPGFLSTHWDVIRAIAASSLCTRTGRLSSRLTPSSGRAAPTQQHLGKILWCWELGEMRQESREDGVLLGKRLQVRPWT